MGIIHQQSIGGSWIPTPDALLARLAPLSTSEDNLKSYFVLQLLKMGLNYVHEAAHSMYL